MDGSIWDVIGSYSDPGSPLSRMLAEATATKKHLLVHVDVTARTWATLDLDGDEEKLRARFWPKGRVRTDEELSAYIVLHPKRKSTLLGVTHGFQFGPPGDGLCRNCRTREATQNWVGDGGFMAFAHGAYERWCERCCVEAQLASARERADAIPELETKLASLIAQEATP